MVNQMIRIPKGCVLWLDLTEDTGDIVYDHSGNGNNGKVYGAVLERRLPFIGRKFDGEDDYIEVPDSPSLDITDEITIMAWVKPNDLTDIGVIVCKGDQYTSSNNHYMFGLTADEIPYLYFGNPTNASVNAGVAVAVNKWSHIAVTRATDDTVNFFINGALVKTGSLGQGTPNNYPLVIGRQSSDFRYFNGIIAHVSIYDCALHPSEIKQLYEEFQRVKFRRIDALNIRMR